VAAANQDSFLDLAFWGDQGPQRGGNKPAGDELLSLGAPLLSLGPGQDKA
jgi:hypothetical protein